MTLSAVLNTSVSGMLAQQNRLGNVANNIANAQTPDYPRRVTNFSSAEPSGVTTSTTISTSPSQPGGSNVDIATEMLNLIGTRIAFEANATVFETGADMWNMLLSMKRD